MATAAAATVPVASAAAAAAGAKTGPTTAATAAAVNDDNYAEDECTIDFGEEETAVDAELSAVGRNDLQQTLNREYQGEDYSHYLMEPPAPDYDTEDLPIPTSATLRLKQSPLESITSTTTRRYQKKTTSSAGRPRLSVANPTLPRDIPAPVNTQSASFSIDDPTGPAAPQFPEQMLPGAGGGGMVGAGPNGPLMTGPPSPEGRRKSLGTIRERLGRFLSTLKQRPKQRQPQQQQRGSRDYPTGTIHNFSFADSKIGLLMVAEQHRQQGGGGSPDGLAALETCSDIGTSRQSWWDVGTLSSARSAQLTVSSKGSSASSRTSRWAKFRKKSTSVPNLRAEDDSGSVFSSSAGVGAGGLSGGSGQASASKNAQPPERSSSSGRDKKTAVGADKSKPSGPAVSPPARGSSSSSSSAGRSSSSTASPPPLPPLRDADSTTHNDGAKIPGFLKRLSRPASRDRTRRQRAEPESVVSTLSYTRTYEEIPA